MCSSPTTPSSSGRWSGRQLEEKGYRVSEAVDGIATLDQCRLDPPDVVLLDIEMPGLDGYEVLVRAEGRRPAAEHPGRVPHRSQRTCDDIVAGLRAGAHDYLKKPFRSRRTARPGRRRRALKKLQDQLAERNAELELVSRTDGLTGLYNRRHLDDELVRRRNDAQRHQEPLCCCSWTSTTSSTSTTPTVTRRATRSCASSPRRLQAELRAGDVAGRWGGEEFLVILPHTDLAGGLELAERIRGAMASDSIEAGGKDIRITVSGGCALGAVGDSADAVLDLADNCLYEVKVAGRNQIVTAKLPART